MEVHRLEDFKGGWFVGAFEPSILRTNAFEVAYHRYKAGQAWDRHTHLIATEYNLLTKGSMSVCDKDLVEGDLFVIKPGEIAAPIYHTDCEVLIIKVPSVPGDKYIV